MVSVDHVLDLLAPAGRDYIADFDRILEKGKKGMMQIIGILGTVLGVICCGLLAMIFFWMLGDIRGNVEKIRKILEEKGED